jgi:hypothetical protein
VLIHVGDEVILLTGDLLHLPNQFANPSRARTMTRT